MATVRPCDRCGHPMEDVGFEDMPPRETGHGVQPTDWRRQLRSPACGYEKTLAETPSQRVRLSPGKTKAGVRGARKKARGKDKSGEDKAFVDEALSRSPR